MASERYIIIPGTQQRVYDGTVVMLHRLPNLRWIIHHGYFTYNGLKQKGWYFSSIPSDTTMPVFNEDLVAMTIVDEDVPHPPCPPHPVPPPGPFPPGPFPPGPGPRPPVPVPIPFTPMDKKQVDASMITLDDLSERDKLGSEWLNDGKVVRVNDIDGQGTIEYYSWNAGTSSWEPLSLGYRYMTREEIEDATKDDIVKIVWSNDEGALVLGRTQGEDESIELTGVAHDPSYKEEDLELRIPIYGKEDLVINIPRDKSMEAIRFEPAYEFPDGSIKPAIVVTVSDGIESYEVAGDATGLIDIYKGGETLTATITITDSERIVTADAKLSTKPTNRLKIDEENGGLLVEVTDLEERLDQLEQPEAIEPGTNGNIVVSTSEGIRRTAATLGGDELDPESSTNVAKESAVVSALSWKTFE